MQEQVVCNQPVEVIKSLLLLVLAKHADLVSSPISVIDTVNLEAVMEERFLDKLVNLANVKFVLLI